jgi:hypothetical protein
MTMRKEQTTDAGFPGIAFATLPHTGETIAIRYGERLYYPVNSAKTADELNAIYGVTETQAKAILESVLADWKTPQAGQPGHGTLSRSA